MFSSKKNKNRRRPTKQRKTSRKRASSKKALLDDEYEKLHAKIGVLESFITNSAAEDARRRSMKAKNILPPPEQWQKADGSRRSSSAVARRGRWEERQHMARRERSGLTFLALFLVACAIVWWLVNSAA